MTTEAKDKTFDRLMLEQISEIEQRDELQVLAELAGETISEYVYEIFDKKGKRTVKLSWVGVREVARARGNIVLEEPIINDIDGACRIIVRATDLKRNFTVFGGTHQPYKMRVKDIDEKTGAITGYHQEDDDFYFQKALSKAQRNALNLCIPGEYAAKMINRFLIASGRKPLFLKQAQTTDGNAKAPLIPAKEQTKPQEQWDKITKEQVNTLDKLARIIWELTKLQPAAVWNELGYSSRADITESPWECFLRLKERFAPPEPSEV